MRLGMPYVHVSAGLGDPVSITREDAIPSLLWTFAIYSLSISRRTSVLYFPFRCS
jgi:hypothetical protein